jgi:hypothetical protein
MTYIVKAEIITGIKGKKYKKGSKVGSECFHPGHAGILEQMGHIEKEVQAEKSKPTPKEDKS